MQNIEGDVRDAGEHEPDREGLQHEREQQRAVRLAVAHGRPAATEVHEHPDLRRLESRDRLRAGGARDPRVACALRSTVDAIRNAIRNTAPATAAMIRYPWYSSAPSFTQLGGTATEGEDREGQHDHPGREQPGAGVVGVDEFGRQRDVRHLEQAERRRGEQERRRAPRPPTAASGSPGGTAKVSTKNTGSRMAPSTMKRRREPVRARLRSLRAPIQGSMMTSQIFDTVNAAPAKAGFTPRVLVM